MQQARGLNATGRVVPDAGVAAPGGGKRAPVVVRLNGHSYLSTIKAMGGEAKLPLALADRTAAGGEGGPEVEVDLTPGTAPREVVVPADVAAARRAAGMEAAGMEAAFATLAFTHRNAHVRATSAARTPETRARRIAKAVKTVQAKACVPTRGQKLDPVESRGCDSILTKRSELADRKMGVSPIN